MMTLSNHRAASVVPESASAGSFLEGLAAQDFAELGGALAAGACPRLHAWFQVLLTGWAGDPPPEAVGASLSGLAARRRP